jgi:hypothetical protein
MKQLLAISCLLLVVMSCSKDDSNTCSTNKENIAGNYKVTGNTYKQTPTSPEENLMDDAQPCDLDDVITFNTNDTYQVADQGVACSPTNDDAGTWSLSGSTLTIDGEPTTIKSFNCKTLVAVSTDVFVAGDQITLTLTKQ